MDRKTFMNVAGLVEGGLVLLAFALAIPANRDPLLWFEWTWIAFIRGVVATLPMLAAFLLLDRIPWKPIVDVNEFLVRKIGPLLDKCTLLDLIYLAALAGFCEEILFRGLLQPWFSQGGNILFGIVLCSVLFGLMHYVSATYAIVAAMMSLYLGWLLIAFDRQNLLTPITTHWLYDLVAFVLVQREYRSRVAAGTLKVQVESDDTSATATDSSAVSATS